MVAYETTDKGGDNDTRGRVVIPGNTSVWPHELDTARALAAAGRRVEFLPRIDGERVKSPDLLMDGLTWEMKSPKATSARSLQRILRRAGSQSHNVIVDTARMRGISDRQVERELRRLLPLVRSVHRVIMVTKDRRVVDICSA